MRLDNFDLNLLVALDILLEERSVTKAAQRVHVTQSAMSASLRRLREAFQDDLFIQHGKKMVPTPRALALQTEVRAAIQNLRGVIATGTGFDPATSRRQFRISASDYITTVLFAPLMQRLEHAAPNIRIDLYLPSEQSAGSLDAGELDLHILPDVFMESDHPRELLLEEGHVVVGCESNPHLDEPLSEKAFMAAKHVAVRVFDRHSYVENLLAKKFPNRMIDVIAQSFTQAPWMVKGTERLTVMYRRLAEATAGPLGLKIMEAPFQLPQMRQMMQYHSTRENDLALQWLKQEIRKTVGDEPDDQRKPAEVR